MPGSNCAIYGCGACRTKKYKEILIFKLPKAVDDETKRWRNEILNVITRDRVIDVGLREQIREDRVYICEQHFRPDQLYYYNNRKTLKEGAIPTVNLPEKSLPNQPQGCRSESQIAKREILRFSSHSTAAPCYTDFKQFIKRVGDLKLDIEIKASTNSCYIAKKDIQYTVPKFEIVVEENLSFAVRVFGWLLKPSCSFLKQSGCTFKNLTLSTLMKDLQTAVLCSGINTRIGFEYQNKSMIHHVVPMVVSCMSSSMVETPLKQQEYLRATSCEVLLQDEGQCLPCKSKEQYEAKQKKRKDDTKCSAAKLKAPLSATHPVRIKLALQENRIKCKQLELRLEEMKREIDTKAKPVSNDLGDDLKELFRSCNNRNIPPFMKLFWEEQQKYLQQRPSQVRYHPMIIKYCLALAAKSTSAYKEMRFDEKHGSGVLILPSLRTLRDYRHYIHPKRGFNDAVVSQLEKGTREFTNVERYIIICFDEMKIQEDLVWDKNSGELIGFVDLGDPEVNFGTLKTVDEVATHVLVFLVKSVVNPLSYSFATFATTGVTSAQLFLLFRRAVGILEAACNLCVIGAVGDGASSNHSFFHMHKQMDGKAQNGVVYGVKNIYAPDRFVFFFNDAPHLMKTARNNLANSGSNKSSRFLWNSGIHILWSHISKLYYEELEFGLKLLPRLTYEHINLTPYSAMRVRLAVQILSSTVAKVLGEYGSSDAKGTAEFCSLMDNFFDCFNVRNKQEHLQKGKKFLKPFESEDDERFSWLENVFLKFFADWKKSIENREGQYSKSEKQAMFISRQTYNGLQRSVHSVIEATRFLLSKGAHYVLTERFCQDDLENYFGRQRSMGQRRDNPNLQSVGYNDNIIKSQFSIVPIAGNVTHAASKFNAISTEPLPKRKRK
ncbi:uncharacterized protein LOC135688649 [Rhopilema esculentum]|uniref:uncharacterized protein LOC135688649 n=1 Tax=Rhopilema esculentum TaxID=499914 RepID=UPI0031D6D0D5